MRRLRASLGANTSLAATGALGGLLFLALLVGSASIYDAVADADGVAGLDRPTLDAAIALRTPAREQWVTAFTNLGNTVPMVVLGLTLTGIAFWRWRRRTIPVLMVIAAAGSVTFTIVGKNVVGRNRPPLAEAIPPYEYAPSFPSGHTLNSTVVAGMLAYLAVWLTSRAWLRVLAPLLAALWAVAIGLSRVFLGHHWLTDVIFGWTFGLAWLALLITAHRVTPHRPARDPGDRQRRRPG